MFQHVPQWLGAMLRNVRAGHSKLVIVQQNIVVADRGLDLTSRAFADGSRLPDRFTADGAGVSPSLLWNDVPPEADSLAHILEDPDVPHSTCSCMGSSGTYRQPNAGLRWAR